MATAKPTKKEEDARLRKALEHADVEKFEQAIKKGFAGSNLSTNKSAKNKKK